MVLKDLKIRISKEGKELASLTGKELNGFSNEVVQAGATRKFKFHLKKNIPTDGSAKFEITY